VDSSLEYLESLDQATRSLGLIKPRQIDELIIRPAKDWDQASQRSVDQLNLDLSGGRKITPLEVVPFDFVYRFRCAAFACGGHTREIFDWEAGAAYRQFRSTYGAKWEAPFRDVWERRMSAADLHFVMGTHHRFGTWMIVGVIYPPHAKVLEDKPATRKGGGEVGTMTLPGFGLETHEGDDLGLG
jgi:hypothetical protein